MLITYSSELYPREVIIKTAYVLTDKYYVHLDLNNGRYCIDITSKNSDENQDIENILNNEIIFQLARYSVSVRTSEIRQLIIGRAFASSMIVDEKKMTEYDSEHLHSADMILKDWFETHEV